MLPLANAFFAQLSMLKIVQKLTKRISEKKTHCCQRARGGRQASRMSTGLTGLGTFSACLLECPAVSSNCTETISKTEHKTAANRRQNQKGEMEMGMEIPEGMASK